MDYLMVLARLVLTAGQVLAAKAHSRRSMAFPGWVECWTACIHG